MAWEIRFLKDAVDQLAKLDKKTAERITAKMREVAALEDPRSMGKALSGSLAGLWRYRVGDYRVICDIEDAKLVIIVIDAAHRSKVYKRRR